jgi:hypothetical protein
MTRESYSSDKKTIKEDLEPLDRIVRVIASEMS